MKFSCCLHARGRRWEMADQSLGVEGCSKSSGRGHLNHTAVEEALLVRELLQQQQLLELEERGRIGKPRGWGPDRSQGDRPNQVVLGCLQVWMKFSGGWMLWQKSQLQRQPKRRAGRVQGLTATCHMRG
jgi:hypothetical protein